MHHDFTNWLMEEINAVPLEVVKKKKNRGKRLFNKGPLFLGYATFKFNYSRKYQLSMFNLLEQP